MKLRSKKSLAITTALFVAAGSTAALAYWTTSGVGSGAAANATGAQSLVLHATWPAGVLAPGGSVPVTITADNPGTTPVTLTSMSLVSITTSDPNCKATDFALGALPTNKSIAAGAGQAVGSTLLTMANSAVSQDACKGATITLNLTSN